MDEVNCIILDGNYFFLEDKYKISIFHEILLKWAEEYYNGNSTEIMFQIFFDQCFKQVVDIFLNFNLNSFRMSFQSSSFNLL